MRKQHCVVCAWRESCARKFCVSDGGAHCPDFTRDIGIPDDAGTDTGAASPQPDDRREA